MRLDKLAWLVAAVTVATLGVSAPAFAQYGSPPPPPPPPPGQGGYYQPAPGYGYQPPPPVGLQRNGLAFGLALGGGSVSFSCEGCDSDDSESFNGVSLSGHLGVSVAPNFTLLLDVWGLAFSPNEYQDVTHNLVFFAGRFFPAPKFWIQGGLGWSYFTIHDDRGFVDQTEDGGAIMGAAGFELYQGWSYSVDVGARLAASGYDDGTNVITGAVQVGFNWY